MNKKGAFLFSLMGTLIFSGCATMNNDYLEQERNLLSQKETDRMVSKKLTNVADSINDTLTILSKIEQGEIKPTNPAFLPPPSPVADLAGLQASVAAINQSTPATTQAEPKVMEEVEDSQSLATLPEDFQIKMKLEWKKASASELLSGLADQVGYKFVNKQKTDKIISLKMESASIEEIIVALSDLVKDKMDISIVTSKKVIEIIPKR